MCWSLELYKMITQEHLEHWIEEINYQLTGILNEVGNDKVGDIKGVEVPQQGYVSFEYLQEKAHTIQGTVRCIEDDIKND